MDPASHPPCDRRATRAGPEDLPRSRGAPTVARRHLAHVRVPRLRPRRARVRHRPSHRVGRRRHHRRRQPRPQVSPPPPPPSRDPVGPRSRSRRRHRVDLAPRRQVRHRSATVLEAAVLTRAPREGSRRPSPSKSERRDGTSPHHGVTAAMRIRGILPPAHHPQRCPLGADDERLTSGIRKTMTNGGRRTRTPNNEQRTRTTSAAHRTPSREQRTRAMNTRRRSPGYEHPAPDTQHPTPNTQQRTSRWPGTGQDAPHQAQSHRLSPTGPTLIAPARAARRTKLAPPALSDWSP